MQEVDNSSQEYVNQFLTFSDTFFICYLKVTWKNVKIFCLASLSPKCVRRIDVEIKHHNLLLNNLSTP